MSEADEEENEASLWAGRGLVAVAAILWSTSGFFAKAPWFDSWPESSRGLMLSFWRSLFALLLLLPLIRKPEWRWPMLPMAMCFALMVWSFLNAMVYGPAANAIWLQYLSPAWVMLGGVVLLKERVDRAQATMFVFCLLGVFLILFMELTQPNLDADSGDRPLATWLGVLSGITFAGVVLCIRSLKGVDAAWLISLNHGATILVLIPMIVLSEVSFVGEVPVNAFWALAFFGVFQMSLPYILFAKGLRHTTGTEASLITLIEPLLVPIWVYVAWGSHPKYDAPGWWTWVGGGLILAGLVQAALWVNPKRA